MRFYTLAIPGNAGCQFQALVTMLSFFSVTSQSELKTCCIVATTNEIQTEHFIAEQGFTSVESL